MPPITDADIQFAETILFGRTNVFDEERVTFIKELRTCDLQAVPGSGKTTALLAKLLIIEKYLPFDDGRSILVISHTNAAVNEIKEKIGDYCPKLFSEPNFIGTIQSFTDKHLTIPYFIHKYGKKPFRIDDEIFQEKAEQFSRKFFAGFTPQEQNNAKNYLRSNNAHKLRFTIVGRNIGVSKEHEGPKLNVSKPRGNTRPANYVDWNVNEKERVYEWVLAFRKDLLRSGYLCFDDAYFLSKAYVSNFPRVKNILQKRFAFVFVDEMQDIDKKQHELIEEVFFNNGVSESVYQRIGDKNQAIYSDDTLAASIWIDRGIKLEFNGSHRLTPFNARAVQTLALSPIRVIGLKMISDEPTGGLKPHLLIYNNNNVSRVIPEFATIVSRFQQAGSIPTQLKHPIKVICWNTKQEDGKIRISNYYPAFAKEHQRPKINYSCLESYLYLYEKENKSIASVSKNLLNGLLRILRFEEVSDSDNKPFTKRSILKFLAENYIDLHKEFRLRILVWSKRILCGEETAVWNEIKLFIPILLAIFRKTQTNSNNFINNRHVVIPNTTTVSNDRANFPTFEDLTFEVTTVHASKGQTHTATLYLESYYQRDIRGSGNYESERLAPEFLGQVRTNALDEFTQQSMKMGYVGFSRPTHLLCFAVHEDRFQARLQTIDIDNWEVIRIV